MCVRPSHHPRARAKSMQLFPINGPCEALQALAAFAFFLCEHTRYFIDRREQCTSDQVEIIKFDGKWNNDAPSKLPARAQSPATVPIRIQCDRIQIVLRRYCSHLNKAHCKMALSAANIARIDVTQWRKNFWNNAIHVRSAPVYRSMNVHTFIRRGRVFHTLCQHCSAAHIIRALNSSPILNMINGIILRKIHATKSDAANILISNRPTHCVLLGTLALRRNKDGMSSCIPLEFVILKSQNVIIEPQRGKHSIILVRNSILIPLLTLNVFQIYRSLESARRAPST